MQKINAAPFWSLILDSTSDITRVDQLSVIVRWVNVTGEECTVIESFLGFIKVTDPNAAGIASTAEKFIKDLGIDFNKLRGQGYDGASVMSGIHAGVQALVKKLVEALVPFVHCRCHNLNLIINDAVTSVTENEKLFGVIKDVFNFFGSSLNRWNDLKLESVQGSLTLKRLCVTRWSSRIDAVRAILDRCPHIMRILTKLSLT